ncbi:MAG: UDP-N-acetylglucosamine--N-acetylmuramyl-(pentapeptide) pyrophosphoryl-undecaprenol N-acetylglucosamine transferase [Phycisphaeraceae bacterium]|nr:UDP-N-acetylglucosamine--N-acetylmuramyl-(pentapeptide) pyrophosphoryl-undecaprenol N-acetylglucosamine transferase [Phycisphaeraceae bacterium]
MSTEHRAYLFAGGGTGGHLFPGLAVAEHVITLEAAAGRPSPACVFLASDRAIDRRILGEARLGGQPVRFEPTGAAPFVVTPRGIARFAAGWGRTVRQTREMIRALRTEGREVRVVALGGFVAAPAVQGARVERSPVTMLNLDAVPGLANRWISKRVSAVFTSAEVEDPIAHGRHPWTQIPPIVRSEAIAPGDAEACRTALGLDPHLPTLVVTGASQGARSINRLMGEILTREPDALRGWQVFHQTGQDEVEQTRDAYRAAGVPARVETFIARMGVVWGAADLAVSRAGAGSVAEVWANRVPAVLMPYPYHKDQHQRLNARVLERSGGAIVVEDRIEATPNMEYAGATIVGLLRDSSKRATMRGALAALGPANGAERVAMALVEG